MVIIMSDKINTRIHVTWNTKFQMPTQNRQDRSQELALNYAKIDFRGSPCLTAVSEYLGVRNQIHFMQTIKDIVRACRKCGFTTRSRMGVVSKNMPSTTISLNQFNSKITSFQNNNQMYLNGAYPDYFMVFTAWGEVAHIHLVNHLGVTLCDTSPATYEESQIRRVYSVYAIYSSFKENKGVIN
tara:strand:+ start:1013 stop:1564 length:552 start_codon:yes stop_codon:yes gene_type:complete